MRCPLCRATDIRTEQCRRCKADLTLLAQLERDRAKVLAAAEWHLGRGEADEGLADAKLANELRGDSDSFRLLALASMLKMDFAGAWTAYQRCGQSI